MNVINDTAKTSQAIAKVSSTPRPAASRGTSRFSRGGFSRGYNRNAPKAATATTSAAPEPSTSGKEQHGGYKPKKHSSRGKGHQGHKKSD